VSKNEQNEGCNAELQLCRRSI